MKLKYYFMSVVMAAVAMTGFTSCSDDDAPDAPVKKDLEFTVESTRVKIGPENRIEAPIKSGNGEYDGYSLDPDIADVVKDENGNLFIEGYQNGNTRIVISDGGANYRQFQVFVYTTDVLTLETEQYELVTPLGYSGSGTVAILLGNGIYSVESSSKSVKASVDEDGIITLTAVSKADPFEAEVTVTDGSGLSAILKVTVKSTLEPFTDAEKAELCARDETSDLYISNDEYEPYYWDGYRENFTTLIEDGTERFGHVRQRYGNDRYWLTISYPEGQALNTPFEATLSFGDSYDEEFTTTVKAVILKNDEISKVAIYSWIDETTGRLERGYFVHVLSDDGY